MTKLNSIEQKRVLLQVIEELRISNRETYFICNITTRILRILGYNHIIISMPTFNKYIIDIGNKYNLGLAWHDGDWNNKPTSYIIDFKIDKINKYIKRLDRQIAKHKTK